MKLAKAAAALGVALALCACGPTWSTSSVAPSRDGMQLAGNRPAKAPSQILVSENDITNKKYRVLGDIEVNVNKSTIFNEDPTRTHVDAELREKAAAMGADAVVLVRYGTVGVGLMSWGSLDGKGRAVQFVN